MKISYNKLFNKLKKNGIRQKDFKEQANINSNTLNKLLHNENVTLEIICRICDYFHCMPDEVMEFIPEPDYPSEILEKQKVKAEVEAQIAALQAKLKTM